MPDATTITEIAYRTWHINECGMDSMYLLEGSKEALLIDTGLGAVDLPSILGRLTSKPIRVAITHGHFDHVGGMGFFDEVAMHPADWCKALGVSISTRREYLHTMMGVCDGLYHLSDEDLREFAAPPSLKPLREGDVIQLGNRDVLVYETPGHTAGGLSFLDVRERILFSGDACWNTILLSLEDNTDPVRNTLSATIATAEKNERLGTRYDRHYFGHVAEGVDRNVLPMGRDVSAQVAQACHDILAGRVSGVHRMAGDFCGEHLEVRESSVTIQYFPWQVR